VAWGWVRWGRCGRRGSVLAWWRVGRVRAVSGGGSGFSWRAGRPGTAGAPRFDGRALAAGVNSLSGGAQANSRAGDAPAEGGRFRATPSLVQGMSALTVMALVLFAIEFERVGHVLPGPLARDLAPDQLTWWRGSVSAMTSDCEARFLVPGPRASPAAPPGMARREAAAACGARSSPKLSVSWRSKRSSG
jgi:hypothetical protein